MRLKDKVVIITGGGQGMGKAISLRFAEEGAAVVIGQRNAQRAEAVAQEIQSKGGKAFGMHLDVTDQKQCDEIVKIAADKFGGLDILVNNAAMYGEMNFQRWDSWTEEDWHKSFDTNVVGNFRMIKAVVPYMRERGKGKIVNISSASVHQGLPGILPYTSSKAAGMSNTRGLAPSLGRYNITVNALAIGYVATEGSLNMPGYTDKAHDASVALRAIRRRQYAEDVAGPALFLASDDSDFVTGQSIVVDGGVEWSGM